MSKKPLDAIVEMNPMTRDKVVSDLEAGKKEENKVERKEEPIASTLRDQSKVSALREESKVSILREETKVSALREETKVSALREETKEERKTLRMKNRQLLHLERK